jgi:hypothetical protein
VKGLPHAPHVLAASVTALLMATAACSGSGSNSGPTADTGVNSTPIRPSSTPEPFYGESNAEVLTPILASARKATSVHITSWRFKGDKKVFDSNLRVTRTGGPRAPW